MHPPAGGSRGIAGSVALSAPEGEPLRPRDEPSQRRFKQAEATGVMPPNRRRRRLRLFAALPPVPLFLALPPLALLLLSAPLPAASGPITCPKGSTWDYRFESCRACSRCTDPGAQYVLRPCEPHRDTQCSPLSGLGIDWSFMNGSRRAQQQKRTRRPGAGGEAPVAATRSRPAGSRASPSRHASRVTATPPPPPLLDPPQTQKHTPRPRTQEVGGGRREVAPEVAARLMDLPSGLREEGLFLLPKEPGVPPGGGGDPGLGGEDVSLWGWRHWLAAGVSMAVVCALALVLAPSALKGLRKRCSHPGSRGRHRDKTKGQHKKIVKSDQSLAKIEQRIGDRDNDPLSSNHLILRMDEIIASRWGSHRQESKNVYEDAPGGVEKPLPPPNSSVLVASMSPGMVQSVRVELQRGSKDRELSTNCLGIDCASRTMFIGRSSAV